MNSKCLSKDANHAQTRYPRTISVREMFIFVACVKPFKRALLHG